MKVTQNQLKYIINSLLSEDISKGPGQYKESPLYKALTSDPKFKSLSTPAKAGVAAIVLLKKEMMKELGVGKDIYSLLALATMGIQGRETKFGTAKSYYASEIPEVGMSLFTNTVTDFFRDNFGVEDVIKTVTSTIDDIDPTGTFPTKTGQRLDTSIGSTQIVFGKNFGKKGHLQNFGKKIGIDNPLDLTNAWKSVLGAMAILRDVYRDAGVMGYDESKSGVNDSINNLQSTGNARLDIAIMAYNTGAGRIFQKGMGYCGTGDKKEVCKSKDQEDRVQNYLPNYITKTKKGSITSIGYVEEVSKYIKNFSWVKKYI